MPTRRVINQGSEVELGGPVGFIEVQAGEVVIRKDDAVVTELGAGDVYEADGAAGFKVQGRIPGGARIQIIYAYEEEQR